MSDFAAIVARLREAGIENPRLETRVLMEHASGAALEELLRRRCAREPLAYVIGEKEFWSLNFAVGPGALVPRPETETLIEAALEYFPDRDAPLNILDLGVGSGCLLLTLLHLYPNAKGTGVDASGEALKWARTNAARLLSTSHPPLEGGSEADLHDSAKMASGRGPCTAAGPLPEKSSLHSDFSTLPQGEGGTFEHRCSLLQGNWAEGLAGPFDLIVSNPPYVTREEMTTLAPELAFEPRGALDGGEDGLEAYRALAPQLPGLLAPHGRILLEIGASQADAVAAILKGSGLETIKIRPDLAGRDRCVEARLSPWKPDAE